MPTDCTAVYFDLGGTLFSNRAIPRLSMPLLLEAAERLGTGAAPAHVGQSFVAASRDANANFVERPYYLHRELFDHIYRGFGDRLGKVPDDEFIEWLYQRQRAIMTDVIDLREDCLSTLSTLRSRGLQLAIVSNIDDDHLEPMLERMNLSNAFDHWTSSEEAQSCKPHRGIFETALAKGGKKPEETLFVGDSRVHDIQGARAMGMPCALIVEEKGESMLEVEGIEAQPDHVISALSELLEITSKG